VAGLAETHFRHVGAAGVLGVAVFAFHGVHDVKTVIKIHEIGQFDGYLGRNWRIFVDFGVTKGAFRDRRVPDRLAEPGGRGVAIGALQLRRRDVRRMAKRRS
jgi:hypothetical protein